MPRNSVCVFGIYPNEPDVADAIDQLKRTGFRTVDLSVLVPENLGTQDLGVERRSNAAEGGLVGGLLGSIAGGIAAWLVNSHQVPATFPQLEQLASMDALFAVLSGLGAGAILGAIIGLLVGSSSFRYQAVRYQGRMRSGLLLLSVHCDDNDWADRAKQTLRQTGAKSISSQSEKRADFAHGEKPRPRVATASVISSRSFLSADPANIVEKEAELSEAYPLKGE